MPQKWQVMKRHQLKFLFRKSWQTSNKVSPKLFTTSCHLKSKKMENFLVRPRTQTRSPLLVRKLKLSERVEGLLELFLLLSYTLNVVQWNDMKWIRWKCGVRVPYTYWYFFRAGNALFVENKEKCWCGWLGEWKGENLIVRLHNVARTQKGAINPLWKLWNYYKHVTTTPTHQSLSKCKWTSDELQRGLHFQLKLLMYYMKK